LAILTAGLFGLDLLVPDLIPLVDEILFGLATLLFSSWKKQKSQSPVIDIQTEKVGQESTDPGSDK
jgi:hypothetical protein